MANENTCVFCGERVSGFRSATIQCGRTLQVACKTCLKELKGLDEEELCRRALVHGLAVNPEYLRERIALFSEAENHRPKCLRCGNKLVFMMVKQLDDTPCRDAMLKEPFRVLPAYCENCGKYEFYNPDIINKNKYLVCLHLKDTRK